MSKTKLFFNFIADYKTASGMDMHGAFKALAIPGMTERAAAQMLADDLRNKGYTPTSILGIDGDYTLQELNTIADDPKTAHEYFSNARITDIAFM